MTIIYVERSIYVKININMLTYIVIINQILNFYLLKSFLMFQLQYIFITMVHYIIFVCYGVKSQWLRANGSEPMARCPVNLYKNFIIPIFRHQYTYPYILVQNYESLSHGTVYLIVVSVKVFRLDKWDKLWYNLRVLYWECMNIMRPWDYI